MANQLRQNLGLDVAVRTQPDFAQFEAALSGGTITGPFRAHWGSLYPSAQSLLTSVFTATGVANLASGHSNDEVTALIDQGNAAPADESATFYHQAEERLMRDFPVIPPFATPYVYAHTERVTDVRVGTDELKLTEVRVAA